MECERKKMIIIILVQMDEYKDQDSVKSFLRVEKGYRVFERDPTLPVLQIMFIFSSLIVLFSHFLVFIFSFPIEMSGFQAKLMAAAVAFFLVLGDFPAIPASVPHGKLITVFLCYQV